MPRVNNRRYTLAVDVIASGTLAEILSVRTSVVLKIIGIFETFNRIPSRAAFECEEYCFRIGRQPFSGSDDSSSGNTPGARTRLRSVK